MPKAKRKLKLTRWDVVDHLKTDRDRAGFLEAALEYDDPEFVCIALGEIARSYGMAQVARKAGLGRESLYKALSANGNPELATVLKVIKALGLKLRVSPK